MQKLKQLVKRVLYKMTNNMVVNNVVIAVGLERRFKRYNNYYMRFKPNTETQSLQEIAGFSHREDIDAVLKKSHSDLKSVREQYLPDGGKVLDIGCGPGLYLKDFDARFQLTGLDINPGMISVARKELPQATLLQSDFISAELPGRYNLIYSIGVLIYIARMDLEPFFQKVYDHLEPGGVFYLNYPHALSWKDLYYPDLGYIQYSPRLIEKVAKKHFEVKIHRHAFDERIIDKYDPKPYVSPVKSIKKTYQNSYLLVAQKAPDA